MTEKIAEVRRWDLLWSGNAEKSGKNTGTNHNAHSSAAVSFSCYRTRLKTSEKVNIQMHDGKQSAHAVKQMQLWHIYTRVYIFRRQEIGEHNPLLWLQAGVEPPQPLQHSPSKRKEAEMTKKEFTRDKTNKQTNRKGRSSSWLSAYLFFQRACLLLRKKSCKSASFVFLFVCFSFFLFWHGYR